MLLAAFPSGLFLSFARTFQRQSARLYRYGAAISGWSGARVLSGECAVTITDQDLFPAGSVTLNGMKIYSDRSVRPDHRLRLCRRADGGARTCPAV